MTLKLVGLALIPALLGSTAVLAQDATPHFALSGSAGVTALNMPSGQNGVLWGGDAKATGTKGQLLIGETFSLSTAVDLGAVGDYDAFMGANVFGTYANGSSSSTQNFSGVGYVAIPGLSTPDNASITLTTTRGPGSATATAVVNETDPQNHTYTSNPTGTTHAVGSGQTGADVSTGGGSPDSFAMSGLNTNVPVAGASSALAYGGVADSSGSIFIASGDLDGLAISTKTRNSILYAGADITFGVSRAYDEKTSVQAYAGPSYRYMGQWNSTNTGLTVDIPELDGTTVTHPLYIVDRNAVVTSNYLGGVVGANISHQVNDTVTLGVGAEGSLYYANANLKGRESVTTTGGDGIDGPSPTVIVNEDPVNTSQSQLAYAVRGQTSATFALSPTLDLTASANVDYLSAVARPYGGANVHYDGNGGATWTSGGPHLSFGGMFAFGGSLSLNGRF